MNKTNSIKASTLAAFLAVSFLMGCQKENFTPTDTSGCIEGKDSDYYVGESPTPVPVNITSIDAVSIGLAPKQGGLELCGSSTMTIVLNTTETGTFNYIALNHKRITSPLYFDYNNEPIEECRDTETSSEQNILDCTTNVSSFQFIGLKKQADGSYAESAIINGGIKNGCLLELAPAQSAPYDGIRLKVTTNLGKTAVGSRDIICK